VKKNILVVGAGFAGATIARELAESGQYNVHVIDQRNHIAGNAYDPIDKELNLRVHQYGPHIFHTNDQRIFDYLSRFTRWIPYEHKVEALVDKIGFVPLPINRTTLNKIYRCQLKNDGDVKDFLNSIKCHHAAPANAQEMSENIYGTELTKLFFGRYTKKMWAMELSELPAVVLARLPVRYDDNRNYFNDKIQAMPEQGYVTLFESLLDHPDISITLSCTFEKSMEKDYCHVFNSMPIDVYFDEKYGALPYRSIRFVHERVGRHNQPVPTINFTDDGSYTRQTDWRLYPGCDLGDRKEILLTKEIPCSYEDNNFERYYPVKTVEGLPQKIYKHYRNEAEKLTHITFIGRCGQYIYYDMHQVVANSLKIAKDYLLGRPNTVLIN
jgi:UDP-galactopyranose mutase